MNTDPPLLSHELSIYHDDEWPKGVVQASLDILSKLRISTRAYDALMRACTAERIGFALRGSIMSYVDALYLETWRGFDKDVWGVQLPAIVVMTGNDDVIERYITVRYASSTVYAARFGRLDRTKLDSSEADIASKPLIAQDQKKPLLERKATPRRRFNFETDKD